MKATLRIRIATENDARAIGILVRRVVRQDVLPDQSAAAGAHLLAQMTARAERARIRAGRRYHIAEIDGRVVGVVATREHRHICRLFVARRFRQRGIARKLLRKAMADSRRRAGTCKFMLFSSPGAVRAYLRMGFVPAGRTIARGPGRVVARPMVYRLRVPRAAAGRSKREDSRRERRARAA